MAMSRLIAKYISLTKALFYKKRLYNGFLLLFSYFLTPHKILGLPLLVQIEPTNRCNLSCKLCVVGLHKLNRLEADLSFDEFAKIIDQLQSSMVYLVLYNFGEPLLNEDIYRMIAYAKQRHIFVRLSTNANFSDKTHIKKIVDSGVDELIISLDYPSAELYLKYKDNAGFSNVIENIQLMIKARVQAARPFINLQLLLTKDTEGLIERFKALARDLNVDGCLIKKVRIDFPGVECGKDILPHNKRYVRTKYIGDSIKKRCYRLWLSTVVLSDGSVIPCCFDVHGQHTLGDSKKTAFKEVWNNEKYAGLRKSVAGGINKMPLCRQCSINNFFDNFI